MAYTAEEQIRMGLVAQINSDVESSDELTERQRLEATYGQVWDTDELRRDFEVLGFAAPICVVRRRETGEKGSIMFQHHPRFYFAWEPTK